MNSHDMRKRAFAMPYGSTSYPRGPYRYTGREHLTITYRSTIEAVRHVVPEPLSVDEPLVNIEFVRIPDSTGFGIYSGAAQTIQVRLENEPGIYTRLMFLDSHPPISGGRELWGFPQKLAGPRLIVERDHLVGMLDAGPVRVATGTMGYKHVVAPPTLAAKTLAEPGFLLKIIPHVDGTPRICELVRYRRGDVTVHGAWTGSATLDLHPHALAPLTDLPVVEVVSGVHYIADFTLELGEVAYDYRAQHGWHGIVRSGTQ
jgi:acetoacetate decarboxylase